MEHVRTLSADIGIRAAGTEGELRGAEYIRDQLTSFGYDAQLQPFPFETFIDVTSRLEVTSPGSREFEALALHGSISGTVEAEVVNAGLGRPEEFPANIAGKIALVQRGDVFFGEKVANAAAAGAAAIIIYNNEPELSQFSLQGDSEIPGVSISQQDGEALLALGSPQPVVARITVQTEKQTEESRNVIARAPGHKCRIVVGGHLDSVPAGPGANDNASGTATTLEIARVLAADGQLDDVCFALFGAEELGLLGSIHYVGALSADARAEIEAMLNYDMMGVGDGWPLTGSADLVRLVAQAATDLGIAHTVPEAPDRFGGSDHASFIAEGIPAVFFNCFCDRPNYHRSTDVFENVEPQRIREGGLMGLTAIARLLAS